tara:strand:+ start:11348 stop:12679 length:1332 start_codon:yes stop_codon:yes gene_type:complete
MPILPKSKYIIKETGGKQFIDFNGNYYKGLYIELNNGSYFKGEDTRLISPSTQLYSKNPLDLGESKNTNSVSTNSMFYRLNPNISKQLDDTYPITSTKNIPNNEDYIKGTYSRYFCKRINNNIYYEIDKATYFELQEGTTKYDSLLFIPNKIIWNLGPNSETENAITLEIKERSNYGISTLFPNLIEFQSQLENNHSQSTSIPKIEGRKYLDGNDIPTNLPLSYKLPSADPDIFGQKCFTCSHFKLPPESKNKHWGVPKDRLEKEFICTKWVAEVKKDYWCNSWRGDNIDYKGSKHEFTYSTLKLVGKNKGKPTKYNIHFPKYPRPDKHTFKVGKYAKITATSISGIYKILKIWFDSKGNIGAFQIPNQILESKTKKLPTPNRDIIITGTIEPVSKSSKNIGKKILPGAPSTGGKTPIQFKPYSKSKSRVTSNKSTSPRGGGY